MLRWLSNLAAACSVLLCVGVCVLWVRGRTGSDQFSLTYDRYLADRSAASTQLHLTSDHHIAITFNSGHVGPFNGQLVWGYYVNADQSGGRPRFIHDYQPYGPMDLLVFSTPDSTPGFGPIRWSHTSRTKAVDGDDFTHLGLGISHWLLALLLASPPLLWLRRRMAIRRQHRSGLCRNCGYDLRATPDRCPECGRPHTP